MMVTLAICMGVGPRAVTAQQTWAPWDRSLGFSDEHDYTSGDSGEWGIDVALPAGTAIYAPESGTVIAYQASSTEWQPGRLVLRLDVGGLIGFGHIADVTPPNTHVDGGQLIATIGDQGNNSHVEFMYSVIDGGPYTPRADFVAYPLSDPRSPWSLMTSYMTASATMTNHLAVINAAHSLYTKDNIDSQTWIAPLNPGDVQATALSGERLAMITGCGALHIKNGLYTPWLPELGCGDARAVALSGKHVAAITGCGALNTKDDITNPSGWTQQMNCGDAQATALSGERLAVISGCGALYIKPGLTSNWIQQLGCGDARAVALSGTHVAAITGCGALYTKDDISQPGGWKWQNGCNDNRAVALSAF